MTKLQITRDGDVMLEISTNSDKVLCPSLADCEACAEMLIHALALITGVALPWPPAAGRAERPAFEPFEIEPGSVVRIDRGNLPGNRR